MQEGFPNGKYNKRENNYPYLVGPSKARLSSKKLQTNRVVREQLETWLIKVRFVFSIQALVSRSCSKQANSVNLVSARKNGTRSCRFRLFIQAHLSKYIGRLEYKQAKLELQQCFFNTAHIPDSHWSLAVVSIPMFSIPKPTEVNMGQCSAVEPTNKSSSKMLGYRKSFFQKSLQLFPAAPQSNF